MWQQMIMTMGLTIALALVYYMVYYVLFYVFFPGKEEMTVKEFKNRRYNKVGFWIIVTLISHGIALIGDPSYMTAFVFAPLIPIILLVSRHYYRKSREAK